MPRMNVTHEIRGYHDAAIAYLYGKRVIARGTRLMVDYTSYSITWETGVIRYSNDGLVSFSRPRSQADLLRLNRFTPADVRFHMRRWVRRGSSHPYSFSGYTEDWAPLVEEEETDDDDNYIEPYQQTHPTMWLRQPTENRPRDDQGRQDYYYLGFEHEFTADEGVSAKPIKEWARDHLGDFNALSIKQDSSVAGFEIVSQPMTPKFFEGVDWDSYFAMLQYNYPVDSEPDQHGLHVHFGRIAFGQDLIALAAFMKLICQDDHLQRISRRKPTNYCQKQPRPIYAAMISHGRPATDEQRDRAWSSGMRDGRELEVNLRRSSTVEVRAGKSTRNPDEFRAQIRLVYCAVDYIRHLRSGKKFISPAALKWSAFEGWVAENAPHAYPNIAEPSRPIDEALSSANSLARAAGSTARAVAETVDVFTGSHPADWRLYTGSNNVPF